MKVSFNPTKKQLIEIEVWLLKERFRTGEGFYCNRGIMKNSFSKNEMATISKTSKTVGFAIWNNIADFSVTIDIAEIKPRYRKKGLGEELISRLIDYLISLNIYVAYLECMPESSESFWRHLGFIDFPTHHNLSYKRNKQLFKILVPHLKPTDQSDLIDLIEVWDSEPMKTEDLPPTWAWPVTFEQGTKKLQIPIIHPCYHDWRIRWKRDGVVVVDEKVKYFRKQRIQFGEFLILKELSKTL